MGSWFDYTVNGLIIGNIYALLAVGLALIFGVSHLINFAQGSIYTVGAYIGWTCVTYLHTPLPVTMLIVLVGCALLGMAIERIGLRPLAGAARIAPLLATIGISFVLDQVVQLVFTPDPRALPNPLPDWRLHVGSGTIGALDLLIAAIGIVSAAVLFGFLRFTKLGWAVRATALDRDAAQQMGVDTDAVNRTVFAIAAALGGLSGMLVGMYFNHIDPAMSFQATLKGVVAQVIGGMGNVPGAIFGSLLLGLTESYGVALFGSSYRNLFAFVLLLVILVLRPNGLFAPSRHAPPEPLTGTFIAPSKPFVVPPFVVLIAVVAAAALPLVPNDAYVLADADRGMAVRDPGAEPHAGGGHGGADLAGSCGATGHRGLRVGAAGAGSEYACWLRCPFCRGNHCIAWHGLDLSGVPAAWPLRVDRNAGHRRDRRAGNPELGEPDAGTDRGKRDSASVQLGGLALDSPVGSYWACLAVLIVLALLQKRLLRSHLGRTFRAIRDDDVAARAYGISLNRYKGLAFAVGGFAAGISGAITAHLYSYINYETFTSQISILALTMVILGGLGNIAGAVVGAVALVGLPELFRFTAEWRMLLYGVVLLLLIRFRPQGLLGTV